MNSLLNFTDVNVKVGDPGFGRCHVCCGAGLTSYDDPVLKRLRAEHPEWFKTPEERGARDTGHWLRTHFREAHQTAASARYGELMRSEHSLPCAVLIVDDKPVHVCLPCLDRVREGVKPSGSPLGVKRAGSDDDDWAAGTVVVEPDAAEETQAAEEEIETVAVKKNKGGRPRKSDK